MHLLLRVIIHISGAMAAGKGGCSLPGAGIRLE